ncbi:MAG: sigma-70 family RNA polymerase sigma factor [Candidatus Pacebacteria bacterium]|jgi:RNA polymerase sigma-70 factor (ECF subfamily)|nr:sigma-70 family RNA polymerase sigma factor [Candidatus Paceibacterota bacterium]
MKISNNYEDNTLIKNSVVDPNLYEDVYKKYADKVFNYFWYRTGHDKSLSEDLMQETFLRAFERREKYKAQGYSYLTYLLTIAHNLLVDHYRKPKSVPVEGLDTDAIPFEITEDIEKKYDAEALWRAVQALPQQNRDTLLMFYQEDMPVRDIAKVMNTSENAIKLSLSRTRKKLSEHPYLQDIALFADTKRKYTKPRFSGKKAP